MATTEAAQLGRPSAGWTSSSGVSTTSAAKSRRNVGAWTATDVDARYAAGALPQVSRRTKRSGLGDAKERRMKDAPKVPWLFHWAYSLRGQGHRIERALLVVACFAAGGLIALALGMHPYLLGSLGTVIGLLAVMQRR